MSTVNGVVVLGVKRSGDALSSNESKRQRAIQRITFGVKRLGESLSREDVKRHKSVEQADEDTFEEFPRYAGRQRLEEGSEDELCHLLGLASLSDLESMDQNTLEAFMFEEATPLTEKHDDA